MSEDKPQDPKIAIVEAAMELGSETGEEGLTVRGIASRLDISATALYQHFDNKSAILREIRRHGVDLLWANVESTLTVQDTAERLERMLHKYVEFAQEHPWLYSVLMEHEEVVWDELDEEESMLFLRPLLGFRESLREDVRRGVFTDEFDVESASFQVWAAVHGFCSLLINGRIAEDHPAFPVAQMGPLLDNFVKNLVYCTLRAGGATSRSDQRET